jgi:hypothetical protein
MQNLHKTLVEEMKGLKERGIYRRWEEDDIKKRITETGTENDCCYWLRTEFGCKLL